MNLHLIPIKRSRKKPKTGDVFVVQPVKGMYYYGKVINESHKCNYGISSNWPLLYFYKEHSTTIKMPEQLSTILLAPVITNYTPWSMGYFYTIGKIPVTDEEKNLDCGFVDYPLLDNEQKQPFYRNIQGEEIQHKPLYTTRFGLSSYRGINYDICKTLKIGC